MTIKEKSQIARTVRLVAALLDGETLDPDSAARLMGVQRAAADTQLKALTAIAGVHVVPGSRPRQYRFERAALSGSASLSTAIAACFGASLSALFSGTSYEPAMAEFRELIHRLTRRGDEFQHIDRKFAFLAGGGEASLPERGGELDDLVDALLHQRWLHLRYQHFNGEISERRVQPLSLVVHQHQLHLVARDAALRLHPYRFSRIESFDEEGTSFEYPASTEYDPIQVFAHSLGVFIGDDFPPRTVEISLNARWATYVRKHRWHKSQRIRCLEDSVVVTLHVRACPELESWILGFGEEAKVLQPIDLRDKIAARLRNASARYGESG